MSAIDRWLCYTEVDTKASSSYCMFIHTYPDGGIHLWKVSIGSLPSIWLLGVTTEYPTLYLVIVGTYTTSTSLADLETKIEYT